MKSANMPPKNRARRDDVATGGVPPPTPPTEVRRRKKLPKRLFNDNHEIDYALLVNDNLNQQKAASEKQNIGESVGQPPMVNSVEDTAPVVGEAIPATATIPASAAATIRASALGTLLKHVFTGSLQLIYMLICIKEIFFLAFCLQIIVSTQKKNLDEDERRLAETVKDAVDLLPHIFRKIYTGARNVKSNYQENDCGRCLTQAFLKRFPGVKVLISKYQEPYTLVCQSEDFYIPENFNERISDSFSMEITSRYRTIVVANRMDPIHKIRWCRTRLEMKPRINIAINHFTIHDTWRCVLQRRSNALGLLIEKENTYLNSKRVADIPICFNAFRNTWCCLLPKQGDTVIFSFGTENEYLDSRQMFVANVIYIALKGNWLYILLKNSNAGQSTCTSETKDTSKKKKEYSIVKLKVDKGATVSLPIITNKVESEACQWMCTAQTSISDIQIFSDARTFLSDIRKECFTMKSSHEDMSDTSMSTVSALRKDGTKRGRSQQK